MPSKPASLAILLCWAAATFGLVRRDVLPEFLIGPPPDLRTIARADEDGVPTEWVIQVADARTPNTFRFVGRATNRTERQPDGSAALLSKVNLDAGDLLKSTPFGGTAMKVEVENTLVVDSSGNPRSLKATLREETIERPLLNIDGRFLDRRLEIKTTGITEALNRTIGFPYEPRTMVQNAFTPLDRLPGLQVGQRWESKVVSPFTGRADVVRVEVERQAEIFWDKGLVKTFVVVQKMPPMSARTWVRPDGLVLRQEVPLPFVRLVLERQP